MYYFLTQLEKTYMILHLYCAYVSIAKDHHTFLVFLFLTPFYRLRVIHKRDRRFRRTSDYVRSTRTIITR